MFLFKKNWLSKLNYNFASSYGGQIYITTRFVRHFHMLLLSRGRKAMVFIKCWCYIMFINIACKIFKLYGYNGFLPLLSLLITINWKISIFIFHVLSNFENLTWFGFIIHISLNAKWPNPCNLKLWFYVFFNKFYSNV
jgi:hypothetical protein